jgi:hypothetical protein
MAIINDQSKDRVVLLRELDNYRHIVEHNRSDYSKLTDRELSIYLKF